MEIPRASGILLHPTSLPGSFGIGDIGPAAHRFVDFLADTGQSWWQILPLGPTGYGNSPYMCFSAFAGNPLLISPELLVEDGFLDSAVLSRGSDLPQDRVDYGRVVPLKLELLQRSYDGFRHNTSSERKAEFAEFSEQNRAWLDDYVLFRAIKHAHHERIWTEWEPAAARREPNALQRWKALLGEALEFGKYLEWTFARQWQQLREYAGRRGVRIIGDLPIYVAHDSAEVWAHRELFSLSGDGRPLFIAGVPPDYFSATGQRWGNPLYRWDSRKEDLYRWWEERMRATFSLVDLVRIDHFRGFEAYWEIPAHEPTAIHGTWKPGPGAEFFQAMRKAIPDLPIVAEDLGVITPNVDRLREECGFPGMRILQMAFGTDPKASEYRPHHHIPHSVVYTATHDHNTTVGWFTTPAGSETTQTEQEVADERRQVLEYLGTDDAEMHLKFIRMAMASVAELAIIPLQDVFGLGTESRMNRPGTMQGNWEWRFRADMLNQEIRRLLSGLVRIYERRQKFMGS